MKENRPLGGLRLPSTRDIAWNMVQLGSLALAVALAYVIRFEGILDAQNIDSLSVLSRHSGTCTVFYVARSCWGPE